MPAPVFVGVGSYNEASGSSVNIAYPAGITAGDIIFLAIANKQIFPAVGGIDAPVGWDVMAGGLGFRDGGAVVTGSMAVFKKVANGSESGNQTITRSGGTGVGTGIGGIMILIRGKVVEDFSTRQEESLATITWNAVTVGGNARTILAIVGQANGLDVSGTPSGYTNASNDGSIVNLAVNYMEDVGADGAITATDGSADGWATMHISIFNPSGSVYIPDH
jgi:hypothetical protein